MKAHSLCLVHAHPDPHQLLAAVAPHRVPGRGVFCIRKPLVRLQGRSPQRTASGRVQTSEKTTHNTHRLTHHIDSHTRPQSTAHCERSSSSAGTSRGTTGGKCGTQTEVLEKGHAVPGGGGSVERPLGRSVHRALHTVEFECPSPAVHRSVHRLVH